jgi:glycosyltransferase involved in cell wall biosynthesis
VLHVLPHPGGGGETYADTLERMSGFEFERLFLAPSPDPREALPALCRSAPTLQLRARSHDLVHVHGEVASGLALPSLALRPSVMTVNGLHLVRRLTGFPRLAAAANLRLCVAAATRTICVSNAERSQTLEIVGARSASRVLMIPNSVELRSAPTAERRAGARAAFGLTANAVVGAWVGSTDDRKDPLLAARAAVKVAQQGLPFTLLVAGDGPLRPSLEQLAGRSEGAVRVLGFRDDVSDVLAASDLFVVTSHREGLPYALLEGMATGLPAVVSDEPGTVEAVGDGGLVVGESHVDAFADALGKLVRNTPLRLDLGRRALARVASIYRAEDMIERTRVVYRTVIDERGTRPRQDA